MVCSLLDRYKRFGGTLVFVCHIPEDHDHNLVKVMLFPCMPQSYTGGVEAYIAPFLTLALHDGKQSASHSNCFNDPM
jgi:hypothetical protein